MNAIRKPLFCWIASFAGCVLLTAISFAYFDMPVAKVFSGSLGKLNDLTTGLGTEVLLSVEAAIALCIAAMRLVRGHGKISPTSKALAFACATSICVYAINDGVLKIWLGVPDPQDVFAHGAHHAFHLFAGSHTNGFPSGHMALAGSFAGVLMRLYPKFLWLLAILLAVAALALVVGDWHFVSDVIAGTFIGVSAGLLAGQLWRDHSTQGG